jgi:predicted phosphodiesterase
VKKTFVHLSDIHFGQEKGGTVVIHDDVKERLIEDVHKYLRENKADGVIVSGDIAYAGKPSEYRAAGAWLDRVAAAAGCPITSIQVVPGNHDIDRSQISLAAGLMLDQIIKDGEEALDRFLESPPDREMLYARFASYRPFAEGYNSPLDNAGGAAGERYVDLGPQRRLRFVGLNTALICSERDKEGNLLLGARQRVLPRNTGEELIVLAHHPLHWLRDSEDARRYVRTRARVLLTGHEHVPSVHVENVTADCDLMLLSAGAAVPPHANATFTYTYNILEFEWEAVSDSLGVTIHARAWSEERKDFEEDGSRIGAHRNFSLACPNFREAPRQPIAEVRTAPSAKPTMPKPVSEKPEERPGDSDAEKFALVLLRFFRDLSPAQRLKALVILGAIPSDWQDPLTHGMERRAIDLLRQQGRLDEVHAVIEKVQTS